MNHNINSGIRNLMMVLALSLAAGACSYQDVADADYPDQTVYMPAAKNGVYTINDIDKAGTTYHYKLDVENNKLLIPMSVYRAGINNSGSIVANLSVNDSLARVMIDSTAISLEKDTVKPEVLPASEIAVPTSVAIGKGAEVCPFDVELNLSYLLQNHNKRYVTAVKITDANSNISKDLSSAVIDLDTRFLLPTPAFTYVAVGDSVTFTNTTIYGLGYEWDFGDGSAVDTAATPKTHAYPAVGASYPVKLKAKGVTGQVLEYDYLLHLWDDITASYLQNYGPFKRSDKGGKIGNLQYWSYTSNVLANSGKGGFYLENGGVMDFFSSASHLTNAKIYQSFDLPQGSYRATFTPYKYVGTNTCYYVVATGDSLPDIENVETDPNVLGYYLWNTDIGTTEQSVDFTISSDKHITLGFVVSNADKSRLQISKVGLYK